MQLLHHRPVLTSALQIFCGAQIFLCLSGCFHFRTELPGVLDLRSDAALAAPNHEPLVIDESLTREGNASMLHGAGVRLDGHRVLIHDRHTWLGVTLLAPGAFLLWNGDGAEPELQAALGERGILRDVRLSHRLGFPDFILELGTKTTQLVLCFPTLLLAPIGPPMSFWASGERIGAAPAAGVAPERAPKPEDAGAQSSAEDSSASGAPGTKEIPPPAEPARPTEPSETEGPISL